MNQVFCPTVGEFVVISVDDILVFNKTLDEYANHLSIVLEFERTIHFELMIRKPSSVRMSLNT